jgi:hypothetical protein
VFRPIRKLGCIDERSVGRKSKKEGCFGVVPMTSGWRPRDTLPALRVGSAPGTHCSPNISAKMFCEPLPRRCRENILGGASFRALLRIGYGDNAFLHSECASEGGELAAQLICCQNSGCASQQNRSFDFRFGVTHDQPNPRASVLMTVTLRKRTRFCRLHAWRMFVILVTKECDHARQWK